MLTRKTQLLLNQLSKKKREKKERERVMQDKAVICTRCQTVTKGQLPSNQQATRLYSIGLPSVRPLPTKMPMISWNLRMQGADPRRAPLAGLFAQCSRCWNYHDDDVHVYANVRSVTMTMTKSYCLALNVISRPQWRSCTDSVLLAGTCC